MLVRHFLIGVIALAAMPVPQNQLQRVMPLVDTHPLLWVRNLSDEISLLGVAEQWDPTGVHAGMSVSLYGSSADSAGSGPRPLAAMDIQAWLLRGDGTALSQGDKRSVKGNGIVFAFAPVPAKELAGVVVSVNGKLYVREIKANPRS